MVWVRGLGSFCTYLIPCWSEQLKQAVYGQTVITFIPAHAAFGGYKNQALVVKTIRMMLDHYQQTKIFW